MAGVALWGHWGVVHFSAEEGQTQSDPSLGLDAEIPLCSGFLTVFWIPHCVLVLWVTLGPVLSLILPRCHFTGQPVGPDAEFWAGRRVGKVWVC